MLRLYLVIIIVYILVFNHNQTVNPNCQLSLFMYVKILQNKSTLFKRAACNFDCVHISIHNVETGRKLDFYRYI